jgi:hypothetical protein
MRFALYICPNIKTGRKYMNKKMTQKNTSENQKINRLKALIINKIAKGDYITLSKILECEQETARKRFHRSNPEAVIKMKLIIDNREMLINQNK